MYALHPRVAVRVVVAFGYQLLPFGCCQQRYVCQTLLWLSNHRFQQHLYLVQRSADEGISEALFIIGYAEGELWPFQCCYYEGMALTKRIEPVNS